MTFSQFNRGPADSLLARKLFYWRFFRLRAGVLVCFVVLGLLGVGADLAGIGLVLPLLSLINSASADSGREILANIPVLQTCTEWFLSKPPQQRLIMIAAVGATLGLVKAVISFYRAYLYNWIFAQLSRDIYRRCYERFLTIPVSQVLLGDTSSFTNTIVSFPRETATAMLSIAQMVINILSGLAILSLVLLVSFKVGLIAILLLVAIAAAVWALLIRQIPKLGDEINKRSVKFYGWIIESVKGRIAIDGLGMRDLATLRLDQLAESFLSATLSRDRLRAMVDPFLSFLGAGLVALLFLIAARDATDISARLSETIVLIMCLTRLQGPVSAVNTAFSDLQTYRNSAERVNDFLAWRPDIQDIGAMFPGLQKRIEFRNVSFCYAERSAPALSDVTFALEKNSMVALVGRSGAGKTTIVSLVMRFFDSVEGDIHVDGMNIKSFSRSSWRRKISYVSQDSFLFDDTIENNIKAGYDASSAEVVEAAKKAHALDFILEAPAGFATMVGENGVRLSGGQKQRIAIARAILRTPDIIILDEATSNLDGVSEHAIREALDELRESCAVLVVAHRISTVVGADLILVMDHGRIVERGTHAKLLSSGALYRQIVELQNIENAA
jgi:ABC-type multidrug transport system fused ATPase/permease subunit